MATTSVLIEEKVPGQPPSQQYLVELSGDRITVKELIEIYVREQVERFNSTPKYEPPRVQAPEERLLNTARDTKPKKMRCCDSECQKALAAFSTNQFFVLVDGRQVSDLQEEIAISSDSKISFLRLVPLVGG